MNSKVIIVILAIVGIAAQFIRPNKVVNSPPTLDDFILSNQPPQEVVDILKNSCYDCHSNQTNSYWYENIVPPAWLIDKDIKYGREALNFSDWGRYSSEDKLEHVGDIMHQVYERKMPIKPYLIMHPDAKLEKEQMHTLVRYINKLPL